MNAPLPHDATTPGTHDAAPLVSVVIKALNEQANIERAVVSALAAVAPLGGEVILADSLSVDRTVELASRHPIRIVRLRHAQDRSCGVGAQLGYQHSRGRYVYVLDGDMQMDADFLVRAVAFLEANPRAGGVGGHVRERNLDGLEYVARAARGADHMASGEVTRLDMGGLYRREAIEQAGYLTDRNLHSYEEVDLGTRLRARGWTLHRIAVHAVDHWGHASNAFGLLLKRWRSRYLFGIGEVVRAAIGQRHLGIVLRELRELWIYVAVLAWIVAMLLLAATSPLPGWAVLAVALLPWLAISVRKRSLLQGSYSVYSWLLHIGALAVGLCAARVPPAAAIDSEVIQ